MAERSVRRLGLLLAAGCLLAGCAGWLAGVATAGRGASSSSTAQPTGFGLRPGPTVRVLQFNLCDSGIAGCFTGRSVGVAAGVIRAERPDLVTLNEVCRGDVSVLGRAMSAAHGGKAVTSAFRAAVDRRTGAAFRCLNGQQYGIGLLASLGAAGSGDHVYDGVYPTQDLADPEERVWLCVDLSAGLLGCTTHAASTSTAVALAQCRYLLGTALPDVRRRAHDVPAVVGADLNLHADAVPGPQFCLPRGYHRADDGSVQDVLASPPIAVRSSAVIDMAGATDHPALLVELTLP
jgi:hypothetical protein